MLCNNLIAANVTICVPFQIRSTESSTWPEGHRWPGDRLRTIAPCWSTGHVGPWQLPVILSGSASADLRFTAAARQGAQVRNKWVCIETGCQGAVCVCGERKSSDRRLNPKMAIKPSWRHHSYDNNYAVRRAYCYLWQHNFHSPLIHFKYIRREFVYVNSALCLESSDGTFKQVLYLCLRYLYLPLAFLKFLLCYI